MLQSSVSSSLMYLLLTEQTILSCIVGKSVILSIITTHLALVHSFNSLLGSPVSVILNFQI